MVKLVSVCTVIGISSIILIVYMLGEALPWFACRCAACCHSTWSCTANTSPPRPHRPAWVKAGVHAEPPSTGKIGRCWPQGLRCLLPCTGTDWTSVGSRRYHLDLNGNVRKIHLIIKLLTDGSEYSSNEKKHLNKSLVSNKHLFLI